MRSILLFVCAPLCLAGAIACGDRSAAAVAAPTSAITWQDSFRTAPTVSYALVIPESFINWKGMHVMGGNGHQGYIKPLAGALVFDASGTTIAGGFFELDMNTITSTDKKDTSNDNGLVSHLKGADFFDVKKYPRGAFRLTKAMKAFGDSTYDITGQLTLRGITQEIHFLATIVRNGEDMAAIASLTIDRTKWGITYQSGSVLGFMKNELLEDGIPVSLVLRFRQRHYPSNKC